MKRILFAAACLLILCQTVIADADITAEEFLKNKLDAVVSVLRKKDVSQEEKNKDIIDIVSPAFDFHLMSMLALGKTHWLAMTPDKSKRYQELFIQRLKATYLDKITLYTDEKVVFNEPVVSGRKVHVPTVLITKNNKIAMLYKLYKSENNWKIYDIEIEGVSIISTFRSQFNELLSTGTIDDLIRKLAEPREPKSKTTE